MPGVIVEQTDPISYRVQVSDQIWRRHVDQLLDYSGVVAEEQSDVMEPEERSSDVLSPETPVIQPTVQSTSGPTPSIEVTAPPQNTEHSDLQIEPDLMY